MRTPAPGRPLAVSSTCVVRRPIGVSRQWRPLLLVAFAGQHCIQSSPLLYALFRMPAYPTSIQGGTEQPIYDAVSEAVLDQRLAPGTRLTEGSLVELFGVSRTIVRMALLRLAHDHIVTLK